MISDTWMSVRGAHVAGSTEMFSSSDRDRRQISSATSEGPMSQPQDPDGKAKHETNQAAGTPYTQHREEEPRPSYRERSRTGRTVFVKVGAVVCSTLFLLGLLLSTHPAIAFGFTAAGSAGGQL